MMDNSTDRKCARDGEQQLDPHSPVAIGQIFRATDIAFMIYGAGCAIAWFSVGSADSYWWAFALANCAVVLVFGLLPRLGVPAGGAKTHPLAFRAVLTILVLPFHFNQIGLIIGHLRPDAHLQIEAWLIQADRWLFATDPTRWIERWHHPVLTELLQWIYASFYFLPFILAYFLLRQGQKRNLAKLLFALVAGFLLSYVGYLLMPARSPHYVLHTPAPLEGVLAAEAIWELLIAQWGINKFDAFPSGHTGVSLILLFYAWRWSRKAFGILLPIVSTLIFSTVYLRFHYFIDLSAGTALAVVTIGLTWYVSHWGLQCR